MGHDTHRLEQGGPWRVGGVNVPHTHHTCGHSDADVLLHALTDALLGALALGDIGERFPDTDPNNRGRDSRHFVKDALASVRGHGYFVANVDCTIHAQEPKLATHKATIRRAVAELLDLPASFVSIKAKTGEGVGPIGSQQAVAADCVVLVIPNPDHRSICPIESE